MAAVQPAFADELQQGLQALDKGDYAAARKLLRPLAEHHGHIKAMNAMGKMEELGLGEAADGSEAAKWYTKAALLGDKSAMYNLGVLYGEGKVVERDNVKSLAWLGAAYDHRQKDALKAAKIVSSRLSEEELAEVQRQREEINAKIYESGAKKQGNAFKSAPVDTSKLLNAEQIIKAYSGKTSTFTFRESPVTEHFASHKSLESALSGKKAAIEGEYRDGYYSGKWWVESDMLCLDYSRLEDFDDCSWIEKLDANSYKYYTRRLGITGVEVLK